MSRPDLSNGCDQSARASLVSYLFLINSLDVTKKSPCSYIHVKHKRNVKEYDNFKDKVGALFVNLHTKFTQREFK